MKSEKNSNNKKNVVGARFLGGKFV